MRPGEGSFLDEIALGRFVEGESPLHRCRTNWKALVFTAVAAITFFFQSASAFFLLGLLVGFVSLKSGLPQRLFWRSLRPVNLLAIFTIASGAFLNHPGAPYFSWEGLHSGGLYAARLVFITLLTTLFFLTTRPQAAITFGINLLRPLKLVGIDREELSLLVHLAYRFVPLLRREIKELALGRKARNLPPPKGPILRAKAALDTLVFLFVGALKRAEITGLALEQRRVVDTWSNSSSEDGEGFGSWMTLLLALAGAVLLWKDPLLL